MEATGKGQYLGVPMSVYRIRTAGGAKVTTCFFIDGETSPSITGTGSEDYFLGAWNFGRASFSYQLYGAPVKGEEFAGSRSFVYLFRSRPQVFTF